MRRPLVIAFLLLAAGVAQAAKPKPEEALYARMEATVLAYQQAWKRYEAGDEAQLLAMNAATEDMEEHANACFKLRTCSRSTLISAYERMIKHHDMPSPVTSVARLPDPESLPAIDSTVKLLGSRIELLAKYNEPVQAAIANWLTVNRAFFMDSWENYHYMRYLMAPEYDKAGLPEALLFGMMTKESGGKVHSTSRAGASGPLQFMPATGRRFGLDMTPGRDLRFDPQHAARANAEYMNERFKELNKSLEMAIAGYNGGEGRARRIYGEHGGDFWQERIYKEWPAETRDYVPAVVAAAWLFLHGEDYGLTFPKLDYTPATFALQRPSSINELTICLGNPHNQFGWFRVLRNLNPHYEPNQFIAQGTVLRAPRKLVESYQAHCLSGPRADMARTLGQARKTPVYATPQQVLANAQTPAEGDTVAATETHAGKYTVKPGETLMMIKRTFDCDLLRLIKENELSPPDYVIRPGQEIKLMGCRK